MIESEEVNSRRSGCHSASMTTAIEGTEAEFCENYDLDGIVTPIKIDKLVQLLEKYGYDKEETKFLKIGFTEGFDIGYQGPEVRQSNSRNLPLRVGSKVELWNKVMKEVKLGRVAGPYDEIPYDNFIQSPIGLVPKAGSSSGKTRLIFHLSYEPKPTQS